MPTISSAISLAGITLHEDVIPADSVTAPPVTTADIKTAQATAVPATPSAPTAPPSAPTGGTPAAATAPSAPLPKNFWHTDMPYTVTVDPATMPVLNTEKSLYAEAVKQCYAYAPYSFSDLEDTHSAERILSFVRAYASELIVANNAFEKIKDRHLKKLSSGLSMEAACHIIVGSGDVALLTNDGDKLPTPTLCYYSERGDRAGTWTAIGAETRKDITRIMTNLGVQRDKMRKVTDHLRDLAPEKHYTMNTHVYPFADGVVEFDGDGNRTFTEYVDYNGDENPVYAMNYGREAFIVGKCAARYRPGMKPPVFVCPDGFEWSPLAHLIDSTDNNANAIKVILQALMFGMRGMSGGRVLWLMDASDNGTGGGGKSTLAASVGAAIGFQSVAFLNFENIANDEHYLGQTVGKRMILGDETSAGQTCINMSDKIKRYMRGEPVMINEKFERPFPYAFHGIWFQCMNTDSPKFLEKEAALYRPVVPVYFPKTYTKNQARNIINDVYARSQETADWIANYALDTCGDVQEYDAGAVSVLREAIAAIRAAGSTAYSFLDEYMPDVTDDEIPLGLMYRFYSEWASKAGFKNSCNQKRYKDEVVQWCSMHEELGWKVERYRSARQKKGPYHIDRWIRDNRVNGLVSTNPNGTPCMTDQAVHHGDRIWLIRTGSAPATDDAPAAPKMPQVTDDDRAYQCYRMSVYALAAERPEAIAMYAPGLVPPALVLSADAWKRLGRPVPPFMLTGCDPATFGYAILNRDGTISTIPMATYLSAMAASKKNPAALIDINSFTLAASRPVEEF